MTKTELTKKIYSLGAVCGIVESGSHDDELHALVYRVTNKSSVRELTEDEACAVIRELKEYLKLNELGKNAPPPSSSALMSERQKALAFRLIFKLIALDEKPSAVAPRDRLCGILTKVTGKRIDISRDIFDGFTEAEGSAVIEEIKRYISTAKAKKRRKNGYNKPYSA